jgi:ornithine cyclodeaminase/alanine dehydrogenase-like protein (mu-crystallin family)
MISKNADDLVLLSGRDLQILLNPKAVVEALRQVYCDLAANRADGGKSLAFVIEGGSAHVKAGLLPGSRSALAAKVNVNLPGNWEQRQLPTIQGAVLLVDAITGRPLAVMDSMTLTAIRTAATAMFAAGFGARKNSKVAAMIGCGMQARYQLDALLACFAIEEIRLFDTDEARARAFVARIDRADIRAASAQTVAEAVDGADICITCTTSKQAVLTADLKLGSCFIAAVGADNPEKWEIDPALMARARILVDDLDQCASDADLAHALRAGTVSRDDVHADLAELAAGCKRGRENPDELVIFDSSGSGLQDVAAAWLAYKTARTADIGSTFNLAGN